MRRDHDLLLDITEAIGHIERYARDGHERFERDELVQGWMTLHLQHVGEAARRVSAELKARHPDVAWSEIVKLRTVLVHHYFDVDTMRLWGIVEGNIPVLRDQILRILSTDALLGE